MKFSVITLFPELVQTIMNSSVIGRALKKNLFELEVIQLRDFADNDYGRIDDTLVGGGTGMLIKAEPVARAMEKLYGNNTQTQKSVNSRLAHDCQQAKVAKIFLSPKGKVFNQQMAKDLATYDQLILLCGHYEGVDDRVLQAFEFTEISLGDYVLTAGEYGATIIMDAVARLLPSVLPNEDAYSQESHYNLTLEQPQYTKPAIWRGLEVPDILLSGHHKKIVDWQTQAGLVETMQKRPELFDQLNLDVEELAKFIEFYRNYQANRGAATYEQFEPEA